MKRLLAVLWLPLVPAATPIQTAYDYPGATSTELWDVNNSNIMLGRANTDFGGNGGDGGNQPIGTIFLATPDKPLVALIVPGAVATFPGGLSNAGKVFQVAGWFRDAVGNEHGYIYRVRAKDYIQFDVPGATGTHLNDVNANGDVIGDYVDSAGTHGFWARNGVIHNLGNDSFQPPVGGAIVPTSINDRGHIVGYVGWPGSGSAFIYRNGAFAAIIVPDPIATSISFNRPGGINNWDRVIGWQRDDYPHAWITHMQALDPVMYSNAVLQGFGGWYAMGINDYGRTVGSFYDPDTGRSRGYIGQRPVELAAARPGPATVAADEVPEPAAAGLGVLGVLGLVALALVRYRRRLGV